MYNWPLRYDGVNELLDVYDDETTVGVLWPSGM